MSEQEQDPYLNLAEAARRLNVSPQTIRRRIDDGLLEAVVDPATQMLRVKLSAILAYYRPASATVP